MLEAFLAMPIVGRSIVVILFLVSATALIAERIRFWLKVSCQQPIFARELMKLYRYEPDLVEEKIKRNINLPIARIFLAALELDHHSPEPFRLAMESELQAEISTIKRFNGILDVR